MANITLRLSGDNAKVGSSVSLDELGTLVGNQQLAWIDILRPGDEERTWLMQQDLHHLAVEDCFKEPVTKAYVYESHRFVVVRARDADSDLDTEFMCAFVTENRLITVRHAEMPAMRNFAKRFGSRKVQKRTELGPEYLLYEMLDSIADDWYRILSGYSQRLDLLEDRVFDPNKKYPNLLQDLHELKQDMREISKSVTPLTDVVNNILRPDTEFTSEGCMVYWHDVQDVIGNLKENIANYNSGATSTRDTYLSQSTMRLAESQKQTNDVMRTLTIIATLMLPITAIASIFGMNIEAFGSGTGPVNLGEVVLIMGLTSIGIIGFFRYKGWIGGGSL